MNEIVFRNQCVLIDQNRYFEKNLILVKSHHIFIEIDGLEYRGCLVLFFIVFEFFSNKIDRLKKIF